MIFITAGTTKFRFRRLEDVVIDMHSICPNQKVIFQSMNIQNRKLPKSIEVRKIIPSKEFIKLLKRADLIISHAGFATVMEILKFSKSKPLLMPRLKKYGEHVNDHQNLFASYMQGKGFVKIIKKADIKYLEGGVLLNRSVVKKYLKNLYAKRGSLINYLIKITDEHY